MNTYSKTKVLNMKILSYENQRLCYETYYSIEIKVVCDEKYDILKTNVVRKVPITTYSEDCIKCECKVSGFVTSLKHH